MVVTVRASRLLSILTTLQARGVATAQALADETDVSLRTIYRDIDALSAAGIPVYSERGPSGGYRLLDGYRTRLNGLSIEEAETLFLLGLAEPAAALGLDDVMAATRRKLITALPIALRNKAERMHARFHLDASAWFEATERPVFLRRVAEAVSGEHPIEMIYRGWKAETQRRVEPLGIVLKSGAWYVVAAVGGSARTFRIARIRALTVLDERFEAPPFDLPAYWRANTSRLETDLHANRATIRLSPKGFSMLEPLTSSFMRAGMSVGEADTEGRRIVSLPVGSLEQAYCELLRFGIEVEVLEPPELRARMSDIVGTLARRYRGERERRP